MKEEIEGKILSKDQKLFLVGMVGSLLVRLKDLCGYLAEPVSIIESLQ